MDVAGYSGGKMILFQDPDQLVHLLKKNNKRKFLYESEIEMLA